MGPAFLHRANFVLDRDHILNHHFDLTREQSKSKFDLPFSEAVDLCPSVLKFPNRVRLFRQGVLFVGVFDGDLGGGKSVLKVWVDVNKPIPIRSFYLDTALSS